MFGYLRTCFLGQPTQSWDTNDLSQGATDGRISSGADDKEFAQSLNGARQESTTARTALHTPRGCPAGTHAKLPAGPGGLGAVYGTYDILEPRSARASTPSFTLSAIAEDEFYELGRGDHDHGSGSVAGGGQLGQLVHSGTTRGSAATARQQPSLRSPAAGGSIGAGNLSFECEPLDSEPCAFAIILPTALSTVFEESDDDDDGECECECGGPQSTACHSADAGCCSNCRLPHSSSLIRGLSAPSCAGSMGSGPDGAPAAACAAKPVPTAAQPPPAAAAASSHGTTRTRGSLAACAGAAAQRSGGADSMAVWYF
ncbi:hypothetical protein PLESTB_000519600 [Pleodorina starrii]|uniref:Uncharacterized protein n=1 Tax=Pleodorina starrii TaxID=330485 RepID=A0A9W6BG46_9CHLO|nr:hypothetical protein PLESTB_000519600 [Pleodorina starrii]GLC72365.1 hypothetical protein PLESTF_001239900 [Pleodorina starrii]